MHRKSREKIGLPPGTLVYTGSKEKSPLKIRLIDYNGTDVHDSYVSTIDDLKTYVTSNTTSWINVIGIQNTDVIEKIGNLFNIHPLVLEDIVNVNGRPKIEAFDDYLFIQIKMIYMDGHKLEYEHLSLVISEKFVISFQENETDVFDPVRDRIKKTGSKISTRAADYLGYALIDSIVDNYFVIIETIGDKMDHMDNKVMKDPDESLMREIHRVKQELVTLRRMVWPVRELVSHMQKIETIIKKPTRPYLGDLYDHVVQVIDSLESYREMASSLLEMYLSSVSNRMNQIMKVLTVISTIFIPLTFITGLYGMNFDYMPELAWKAGYPLVWVVMVAIALGLLYYFRKLKWL